MLPRCTVHMLLLMTVSLTFLFRMKLNGCRFLDSPVAFQRLVHFTTSKPPTGIPWYATFDIPSFWCGMTRVLKNCESERNLTLSFLTRATTVMWALESQITEHRLSLQCSFVNILPSSCLGHEWTFAMAVSDLEESSCEARFPWKNIRSPRTVGRIKCEFTITCESKTHFIWENTRKVNPRNAAGFLRGAFSVEKDKECGSGRPHQMWIHNHLWTQDTFYLRKHKESEPKECGRIPARRIFCGKRQGMWKRPAASDVNLQSHWTQDAPSLKKHMESGRVSATHVFLEKRYGIRERSAASH